MLQQQPQSSSCPVLQPAFSAVSTARAGIPPEQDQPCRARSEPLCRLGNARVWLRTQHGLCDAPKMSLGRTLQGAAGTALPEPCQGGDDVSRAQKLWIYPSPSSRLWGCSTARTCRQSKHAQTPLDLRGSLPPTPKFHTTRQLSSALLQFHPHVPCSPALVPSLPAWFCPWLPARRR